MSDVAPPDSASPGREILPSGPAGTQGLASAGPVIQGLAVEALAYAEASDAPATRRAYNSAWRAFEAWCAQHGQQPMPASAGAVAMYLVAGARRLAVSSLMVHRAAIDEAHRALDHPRPDSAHLRKIWKGIRKTHGRPPAKKRALTAGDLRRALKATPATMAGARDRALILVGFASALRRSELAALTIGGGLVSAHFVSEGLEIVIAKSKGDQLGAGATVPIPHGRQSGTCPVRALQDWLSAAGIVDGPVFRAVDRLGRSEKPRWRTARWPGSSRRPRSARVSIPGRSLATRCGGE
jgi:hypothetical protein